MYSLLERQVEIDVHAISMINEGIEHSNKCTLFTEEKKTDPFFCGGIGKVLQIGSSVVGVSVGDSVIFCGYMQDQQSRRIITATNNIVRISDTLKPIYAICGYVAFLINSVKLIKPSVGSDVILFGSGLEGRITKQLLNSLGCNVYSSESELLLTDGRLADAAVLSSNGLDNSIIDIVCSKCKETAQIVIAGTYTKYLRAPRQSLWHCINSGSLILNRDISQHGVPYPSHYVTDSTSKNLLLAYRLIKQGRIKFDSENSLYTEYLKENNIASSLYLKNSAKMCDIIADIKMKYHNHINPGLLSMIWHAESDSVRPEVMLATAASVLASGVEKYNIISSDRLYHINAQCVDGSVLNGCIVYGALKKEYEIALHYDGSSILYRDRKLRFMVGEEEINSKEYEPIIEFGFDYFEDSLGLESWRELTKG